MINSNLKKIKKQAIENAYIKIDDAITAILKILKIFKDETYLKKSENIANTWNRTKIINIATRIHNNLLKTFEQMQELQYINSNTKLDFTIKSNKELLQFISFRNNWIANLELIFKKYMKHNNINIEKYEQDRINLKNKINDQIWKQKIKSFKKDNNPKQILLTEQDLLEIDKIIENNFIK